ncbi:MAG: hypothetical protein AAF555_12020 [Verrucomicrobiota bacterium]
MRNWPIANALLLLAGLWLLSWPLVRLTGQAKGEPPRPPVRAEVAPEALVPTRIDFKATAPIAHLQVEVGGLPLSAPAAGLSEGQWEVDLPIVRAEPLALRVLAVAGTEVGHFSLQLRLEPEGLESRKMIFFGDKQLVGKEEARW